MAEQNDPDADHSQPSRSDTLFRDAEHSAFDFSLFPRSSNPSVPHNIEGLVAEPQVRQRLRSLGELGVDEYVLETVAPAEDPSRPGIRTAVEQLQWRVLRELERGPLYAVEVVLEIAGEQRKVGILAQDRSQNNGAWTPEQHHRAVQVVREFALQLTPVVTFIDTPGAVADAGANRSNQAHTISRLIAEMAQLHVPTVGVIYGNGYSGGAIPLATTNILLSVVDGVFNTIQPKGLANIARKYNLSWQECAKAVGVSAYELDDHGYLDGVIDYSPLQGTHNIQNLERAICSSIEAIEELASHFAATNSALLTHYQGTVQRFVAPTGMGSRRSLSTISNPTQQPNVYGVAYRYLRYLGLRKRVRYTTVETYARLATVEIPAGDLDERTARESRQAFLRWVEKPLTLRYDDVLASAWANFEKQRAVLKRDRGAVATFLLGTRERNFADARDLLVLELGFHVYNVWKSGASTILPLLIDHLDRHGHAPAPEEGDLDVLDVLLDPDVREAFTEECRLLILFDSVYNRLLAELKSVAFEAMETNQISRESVGRLIDASFETVLPAAPQTGAPTLAERAEPALAAGFSRWLRRLVGYRRRGVLLKSVADWKKAAFPTVSEPLFGLITFFFDHLLPRYYDAGPTGRYDGRIRPRNIGIKDFWSRLDRAYKDLLIQEVLLDVKRRETITPARVLDTFFTDVEELHGEMMTADPVEFPGFRIAIERALERKVVPCGTIAALASVQTDGRSCRVGVLVSNLSFQAGSFDMASGVKLCRLLVRCAEQRLPAVCFVSSGGMQTKEGAGALFSMAIVNDRITRFVRDTGLPMLVFGFGDCTGGAQASLVTHPLVNTFYFSGTSMPFAGQIVVPSHLPTTSTLSNYLSAVEGAMAGLVEHPFAADLGQRLRAIDPDIPLPTGTVEDVMTRALDGKIPPSVAEERPSPRRARKLFRPVETVLVHARGCTAVKLVDAAHEHGLRVVLVQSDPDMESVAATRLSASDTLVCLGGSTPDESYLNAHSVIRIAEAEGCDALHPGIGFLSESPAFADLCARHALNFIGPGVSSLEQTGNKSNAVRAARRLGIPVVPGSHGVVTGPDVAVEVADEVGYPVLLKAVHGGGGRGIAMVRTPEDLPDTFLRMGAEAQSAFGSRDLYIEKLVGRFRHVEVQILRDRAGYCHVLGLRDCSVQRKQQKVVEESGSTLLTDELRNDAFTFARRLADDIEYVGAGTVEFIFDLDAHQLYFMEVNGRLQVEHPVTEATTGVDIVRQQFRIASGESLEDLVVAEHGYAIELRINAERLVLDPESGIRIVPDPGRVSACSFPTRPNVRVISAVEEGGIVSPFYDNLLAQVIGYGETREEVVATLLAWLGVAQIEGIGTNIPLLARILRDDEFIEGRHDTGFVARLFDRLDTEELAEEAARFRGPRAALDRSSIEIEGSDELKVVAQGPCVFYGAAGPGRADFVSVGDHIRTDTTLCLTEAMKLFEELSLETFNGEDELYARHREYEIVRVNAHVGQLLSEGDLLFVVRPC